MENMLVRFIPTDHSKEYGWNGNKPALCFRGEKKAHCVIILEDTISTIDLPLDLVEKCQVVTDPGFQGSGVPYAPERFVKRILETKKPLTADARRLLQSVGDQKIQTPLPQNVPFKKKKNYAPHRRENTPAKTAGAEPTVALAAEWKLPSPKLRRFLRSQGLSAPYQDESLLRGALKKLKKGK